MNYREALTAAHNESDVEQKMVFPFLTLKPPIGLGFLLPEVRTKTDLRKLVIGKGKEEKLYYPDYVAILAGLPVAVVEVKDPSESLEHGLREARLYAQELNAKFPSEVNPVVRILCSNGREIWAGYPDSDKPIVQVTETDFDPSSHSFASLVDFCSRDALQLEVAAIATKLGEGVQLVGPVLQCLRFVATRT